MKRIFLACLFAALAASAATENQYFAYLAALGVDPDEANASGRLVLAEISSGAPVVVEWNVPVARPAPAELPAPADADAYLADWRPARKAAKEASRQAAKSARLKGAEKQLVKFLRGEGAIAADAVSATPEQVDAMYAAWEATLNDAQIDKKSTKYTRLLEKVERAGGTEADAFYHE